MKTIILTLIFLIAAFIVKAQQDTVNALKDTVAAPRLDTVWRRGGLFSLNLSQVSLTNWSAGGENSIGGNAIVNYFANYKKGKHAWDNSIDLEYGVVKQGKTGKLTKSVDKIEFNTIYGYQASKVWYYGVLANFRSQFTAGYNYPNDTTIISNFLAPAYISLALGMYYKPDNSFSLFLSPASVRAIIVKEEVLNQKGAFGVDTGKTARTEFGASIKAILNKDFSADFNLQTSLELYSNYLEKPQNVDVNWQMLMSYKLNKFISATLSAQLIYDDNTKLTFYKKDGITVDHYGPGVQFREVLGVGFAYKPVTYNTRPAKQPL
jgi:hypothetical protein